MGRAFVLGAAACGSTGEAPRSTENVGAARALDLLIVADTSPDADGIRVALRAHLPGALERLIAASDGEMWMRYESVRVGAVDTDLGLDGAIPACEGAGRDGTLLTGADPAIPGCVAGAPFHDVADRASADAASFAVACASSGSPCGVEQPLESVLKALTPSTSPLRFRNETAGHADGANSSFRRAGADLAVLLVTDEDDCSVLDVAQFVAAGNGEVDARCVQGRGALGPVSRYVDGLVSVSPAEQLTFFVIGAVPPELAAGPLAAARADPRMRASLDDRGQIVRTCAGDAFGLGFPPERLVAVAAELDARGARAGIGTLCGPMDDALDAFLATVRRGR